MIFSSRICLNLPLMNSSKLLHFKFYTKKGTLYAIDLFFLCTSHWKRKIGHTFFITKKFCTIQPDFFAVFFCLDSSTWKLATKNMPTSKTTCPFSKFKFDGFNFFIKDACEKRLGSTPNHRVYYVTYVPSYIVSLVLLFLHLKKKW